MLVLAVCLALPALALAQDQGALHESALRATLDRHLEAINARDLDTLLATVSERGDLVTILPGGRVLQTREAYQRLHVDWFADPGWRLDFQVEDVRVVGDAGIARVRYRTLERDDAGGEQARGETLLVLVFAREAGEWRLVHDQNTVVQAASH